MFAVLHIPDFALHAVLRTETGTSTRPAALFSGTTKKSVSVSLNSAARAAGVELGMTSAQAVARCPDLLIRTANPEAETEARAMLLATALLVSPHVEDTAPGLVTLDVHGLAPAIRQRACAAAIARLAESGFSATAGVARTPLLARYAAQAAHDTLDAHQPSAESEIHIVAPEAESAFLAPLPLAVAEPDPELASVLHTWGLRTFGDLTALSRADVGERLGPRGIALWDRARGGEPRPLNLVTPPRKFVACQEFEDSLETLEPLLFILRRFLDRLTLELEAAHRVAAELALTLTLEDDQTHHRSFRLPEPTRDATILFRAVHTHLESLRTAAAIVALRLQLTPARPLVRQHGLFETGLRDPHGFSETLARLAALLGTARVGTPRLEDSHRPDAVRLAPPPSVVPPPVAPPVHPPLALPLRRFRPPRPARVSEMDGAEYLWADGLSGEISFRSPPYPSSGHWWQTDLKWERIEWDIALSDGGLYRLIQVGEDHFIEGEYD